jgi:hypothetical protein
MEQDVIHRLAPAPRAFGEDTQVGARLFLADEIVERLGPERAVGILGQTLGARNPGWDRDRSSSSVMAQAWALGQRARRSFLGRQQAQGGRIISGVWASGAVPATSATARAASAGA